MINILGYHLKLLENTVLFIGLVSHPPNLQVKYQKYEAKFLKCFSFPFLLPHPHLGIFLFNAYVLNNCASSYYDLAPVPVPPSGPSIHDTSGGAQSYFLHQAFTSAETIQPYFLSGLTIVKILCKA